MHKDYYKILGVEKRDSIETIKKSFYKLAMKHHPDKGGNPVEFIEVKEAYEVLTNPAKRADYDHLYDLGSFVQYNDFSSQQHQQNMQSARRQRSIVVDYDAAQGGYVYMGNVLYYDSRSGTWRFGNQINPM